MTIPLPDFESMLLESLIMLTVDAGTTQPSPPGSSTLSDGSKNWSPGMHRNKLVKVIKGTGAGQARWILGNSANSLTVETPWAGVIGAGATYIILNIDRIERKIVTVVLNQATIAAGATTTLANCVGVDLSWGELSLALTVLATYNAAAVLGLRVHVRTSPDGVNFDTEDWDTWDIGFTAGVTVRHTEEYMVGPAFIKVLIENLDPAQAVAVVQVISTVGGMR